MGFSNDGGGPGLAGLSVSPAAMCVPDVDLSSFPWSKPFSIDLISSAAFTVTYLSELAAKMLDWQMVMAGLEQIEQDDVGVRLFLLAKRVHARVTFAQRVLVDASLSPVDKVSTYNEAVQYLETIRGWQCELFARPIAQVLQMVLSDRTAYDVFDSQDRRASAEEIASVELMDAVHTITSLSLQLGDVCADIRCMELLHVVVVGIGSGNLLDLSRSEGARLKPVVPVVAYEYIVGRGISRLSGSAYAISAEGHTGGSVLSLGAQSVRIEYGRGRMYVLQDMMVSSDILIQMYINSLETSGIAHTHGYCYLKCVMPVRRAGVAAKLGLSPTVQLLRQELASQEDDVWLSHCAEVQVVRQLSQGKLCHVLTCGLLPMYLEDSDVLAGTERRDTVVYNALASVFSPLSMDIVARSNDTELVSSQVKELPKLQASTGVDSPNLGDATMDQLAEGFFSQLGVLCDRTPAKVVNFSVLDTVIGVASAEWVGRDEMYKDTDRARYIEERMQSGPVVSDAYCKAVARRHSEGRSRPPESLERGCALQFGSMYAPKIVASDTPWERDKELAVPGWVTYMLKIPSGEHAIVLTSPVASARDCRLDWNGRHSSVVVADSVRVMCDGTVMWFTVSLPVRVKGRKPTVVRCSVPLAGSAYALGWSVKRFGMMHQSIAVRVFHTVKPSTMVDVNLKSKWKGTAGVSMYTARVALDSSALPFGLRFTVHDTGQVDLPAMVGVRSSDAVGLDRVSIGGVTLLPDSQGKVTVVTTSWREGFSLLVSAYVVIKVSVLVITDPYAFEVHYAGRELSTPTSA